MVEISYREHSEQADLASKSVAQAREQYQRVFGILNQAKAAINGVKVEKMLEHETPLKDGDRLFFGDLVEVSYGKYKEEADLAGLSVAQVRELYQAVLETSDEAEAKKAKKQEKLVKMDFEPRNKLLHEREQTVFNISDRAQVKLNGKRVKKDLEYRIKLFDGDKLAFIEKGKMLPLVAALLLALAATGGVFAYVTATVTITPSAAPSDFARVEIYGANQPAPQVVLGRHKGSLASGCLFAVQQHTNYTGDLKIVVYLTNVDELVECYQFIGFELQLKDTQGPGGNIVDEQFLDRAQTYQLLTMENGLVIFELKSSTNPVVYVYLAGGSYTTTPWGWLNPCSHDYRLYCEVHQY